MIKMIIADDHTIVRAGLRELLSICPDMAKIDEAYDGQDLLKKVRKKKYDVILLDISMPGRNGIEILKQIKIERPNLPILVLSMHPEDQYAVRTLKAGASGYLTKNTTSDKLIEAIKTVHQGGKYITSSLAEVLAHNLSNDRETPLHKRLSDREYHVFCQIGSGKTVSQIASEMFLSAKTISTYRRRILSKMDMKNNAELIYYAIKNNLVN